MDDRKRDSRGWRRRYCDVIGGTPALISGCGIIIALLLSVLWVLFPARFERIGQAALFQEAADFRRRSSPARPVSASINIGEFRHGNGSRIGIRDSSDLSARLNQSFPDYGQVKAIPPALIERFDKVRLAHGNPKLEAGETGLCHPEARRADFQFIADGDFRIEQPIDRKVLSEAARAQVIAPKKLLPVLDILP